MRKTLIDAGWSLAVALLSMVLFYSFTGRPTWGGFFVFLAIWVMSWIVIAQRPRGE